MQAPPAAPSPAEVTTEVSGLLGGLGIITMALFPFALPGLLLALPLVILVAPLALVAMAVLLLRAILILPFRLARAFVRSRSGREPAAGSPGTASSAAANAET
jgi:hypothetical protein